MGAIRFDASGDSLSRARLAGAKTVMAWIYISVDRNDYTVFLGLGANELIGTTTDGTTLLHYDGTVDRTGTGLSVGTWYHLAYVSNGDDIGSGFAVYLNGTSVISASGRGASTTGTNMYLGNDEYSEWLNGRLAHIKVWSAALTATEILQEMVSIRPHRFTNLHSWLPTVDVGAARATDYAGQGNTWTTNGTLADEAGPPVGWGAPVWALPFVAGGTNATVAVAVDVVGVVDPAATVVTAGNATVAVAVDVVGVADPSATVVTAGNATVAVGVDAIWIVQPSATAIVIMVVTLTASRSFGLTASRSFGLTASRSFGLTVDRSG